MAKYIFIKDFHALGTNIVPKDSQMATFKVEHDYKAGDMVEGKDIMIPTQCVTAPCPEMKGVSVTDSKNGIAFNVGEEYLKADASTSKFSPQIGRAHV